MLKKRCDWRMKREGQEKREKQALMCGLPSHKQKSCCSENIWKAGKALLSTPQKWLMFLRRPGVLQRRAAQELSYHSSCCPVTDMCRNQKPAVPAARTWGNALTADVHLQTKQCDVVVGLHSQMGAPHKLWGKTHFELKNMTLVELHFPLNLNI